MQPKRVWSATKTGLAEDEEDPWADRRDEMGPDSEEHETPFGDYYRIEDTRREEREMLLGDDPNGLQQKHIKSILAKEVFNCAVHEVDQYYSVSEVQEQIAKMEAQSEIDSRQAWKDEQNRKLNR